MTDPLPVCVVDDDPGIREAMTSLLRSAGHVVEVFASATEFLGRPAARPLGCLVLDFELPGLNGLELQQRVAKNDAAVPIIFVTGRGDIATSVRAMKAGAREFFTKPYDAEELLEAIDQAVRRSQFARSLSSGGEAGSRVAGIVGASESLRELLTHVRTVAPTDATVLIRGETGTGKELVARAIHELSPRKDGPFVKLNCAAIPTGLLESELMGHEKGAFTGALERRIGRFEMANNGTIFLDEIGEMAVDLQPKLLRLLQEREFERVGGSRTLRSNVRVIAATNRDLAEMVGERTFREDLYYRLNVFPVETPPLRERAGDIPLLVEHFVREVSGRLGKRIDRVAPATMARLEQHDWPGNIRELQNVVERAVILATDGVLEVSSLRSTSSSTLQAASPVALAPPAPVPAAPAAPPASVAPGGPSSVRPVPGASDDLADVSRAHILAVLEASQWVVGGPHGAAARLGLKRSTLNFRMKKLGIVREAPVAPRFIPRSEAG